MQVVFGNSEKGNLRCAYSSVVSDEIFKHSLKIKKLDIITLAAALDIGDIQESPIHLSRKKQLAALHAADSWNGSEAEDINFNWDLYQASYEEFIYRSKRGEDIRIWYSDAPYSKCGFYSVLFDLANLNANGTITAIKLPEWYFGEDHLELTTGWGQINPEDWQKYLQTEFEISKRVIQELAIIWNQIKIENSPLRACINGQVFSVGIDFYDYFIRRLLPDSPFIVSTIITDLMKKYPLGISDWISAQRIKSMIQSGEIKIVKKESRFYDSILIKA